jgi:hypothetical protein
MEIEDRVIQLAVTDSSLDAGWFAVRQPGIARYLEGRLEDGAHAVAAAVAVAIVRSYERKLGLPTPRVMSSAIERAEIDVLGGRHDLADRQPGLTELISRVVASPPAPLDKQDRARLACALAAVLWAVELAVEDDLLT